MSLICLDAIVGYLTDPGEHQSELDEASLQPSLFSGLLVVTVTHYLAAVTAGC